MSVDSQKSSSWKWAVMGLLLLATTINYMDRVTLAGASVRVTHELALRDAQYGDLELVFGWSFAAGSLVFGFLADRLRIYFLYPAVLVAWSLMGMATGWTHGFRELLIFRALLGFFEAGHWPCALKTTFALLNEKDRTMGNSVLQSGASLGAVITPQILRLLMTDQPGSWRTPFVAVGAAGLLWVLLWFVFLRRDDLNTNADSDGNAGHDRKVEAASSASSRFPNNPIVLQSHDPHPPAQADASSLWAILRGRRFWAVAILIMGAQIVWHIYRVWLMKFLQTGRGYEESAALNFNSLYFIATDAGCIVAGMASLWLIRRRGLSAHDARRFVYAGACALTSLSVFIPWMGHGWPLLATLLLIGAGALALFPCYYSFVQELSPAYVGRLTGLLSLWVWAVTSPLQKVFGIVADHTRSYDLGLVAAGLAPWIGVIAMKFLWAKDDAPLPGPFPLKTAESYAD